MAPDNHLLARIREEFREMPGLRLTVPQACRLWQLDAATCLLLLEHLVIEGYLYIAADGTYATAPSMRLKPAKAGLPSGSGSVPARRRA